MHPNYQAACCVILIRNDQQVRIDPFPTPATVIQYHWFDFHILFYFLYISIRAPFSLCPEFTYQSFAHIHMNYKRGIAIWCYKSKDHCSEHARKSIKYKLPIYYYLLSICCIGRYKSNHCTCWVYKVW